MEVSFVSRFLLSFPDLFARVLVPSNFVLSVPESTEKQSPGLGTLFSFPNATVFLFPSVVY